MKIYTIKPQPFGEDAIPKEIRFIVATARARGERIFGVDLSECSQYLRTAARHALSALKREGRVEFHLPAERLTTEDAAAVLLLERMPSLAEEREALAEQGDALLLISL